MWQPATAVASWVNVAGNHESAFTAAAQKLRLTLVRPVEAPMGYPSNPVIYTDTATNFGAET